MFAVASGITYNWVWIVLGVFAIVGSIVEVVRFLGHHAVRNDKLDELLKKVTPNGGDSSDLGDIAQRTEKSVDELRDLFNQHLGHSNAVEHDVFRRLKALETK